MGKVADVKPNKPSAVGTIAASASALTLTDDTLKGAGTAGKTSIKTRLKARIEASPSVAQQVEAIGRQIQQNFGVVVVPKRKKASNPYAMTGRQAASIMQKAGILTRSGKLSSAYK